MLGGVGGQAPLSLLVSAYGWRLSLQFIALAGVILAACYLMLNRDKAIITRRSGFNFRQILLNQQAWLLSVYSGLAFAPVSVFGGLWGVPFLQQAYAFSPADAAFAVSWIFIGFAIGAPILGWFSDYILRRKPVMLFGTVVAFMSLCAVLSGVSSTPFLASLCCMVFGFGASGFFISFSMIRELFPFALTATVLGFMNTFDALCEAVSEPIVGLLLDWGWDGQLAHDVPQFSVYDYQCALALLPVYLLLALLVLSRINETYCKSSVA
jgi:sugar phosphate permease